MEKELTAVAIYFKNHDFSACVPIERIQALTMNDITEVRDFGWYADKKMYATKNCDFLLLVLKRPVDDIITYCQDDFEKMITQQRNIFGVSLIYDDGTEEKVYVTWMINSSDEENLRQSCKITNDHIWILIAGDNFDIDTIVNSHRSGGQK